MPILPAEPCLYPDDLLSTCESPSDTASTWRVLHVKPRQEKSLGRELLAKGVSFYLPMTSERRQFRGRMMSSHLPLFPGYLFLHGDLEAYHASLSTNRVVRALNVADQRQLWQDLHQLHRLLATGLTVQPEMCLEPGQRVEVTSGPLAGFRGTILRGASGRRFVVSVDFIHQGASVLCEGMSLRPLVELH